MAKYKNQYNEEVNEEPAVEAVPQELSSEEETFKKRYGDLRRHQQKMLSEKDAELAQVQAQLQEATRKQIKFPKTEKEVSEWATKYPDVAKIIDTIAQKRVSEGIARQGGAEKRVAELEGKLNREHAEKELRRLHPDFDSIRTDPKFHDWVALQPSSIQDALYKNSSDAATAARCIDLYKNDQNIKTKTSNGAAKSVGRSSSTSPTSGKYKFSESMIEKMSTTDYEKNEEAIMASIRNGTFEYDQTGAAR